MGVGVSACKGLVHPNTSDPNSEERELSTVTRLPFLSAFEDRPPFKPTETLSDKDSSLLKALTHHRTPFAVVQTDSPDLNIIYASGGCVAGLSMPAENIEGSSLAGVLKKGIKMQDGDISRLEAAVRAKEVRHDLLNNMCPEESWCSSFLVFGFSAPFLTPFRSHAAVCCKFCSR